MKITSIYSSYVNTQIWSAIKQKLMLRASNIDTIANMMSYLAIAQRNKKFLTDLVDITISSTVWHIWVERNQRVFQSTRLLVRVRTDLLTQD